jgi:hypothetical protein
MHLNRTSHTSTRTSHAADGPSHTHTGYPMYAPRTSPIALWDSPTSDRMSHGICRSAHLQHGSSQVGPLGHPTSHRTDPYPRRTSQVVGRYTLGISHSYPPLAILAMYNYLVPTHSPIAFPTSGGYGNPSILLGQLHQLSWSLLCTFYQVRGKWPLHPPSSLS